MLCDEAQKALKKQIQVHKSNLHHQKHTPPYFQIVQKSITSFFIFILLEDDQNMPKKRLFDTNE